MDTKTYDAFVQEMWFNDSDSLGTQRVVAALGITGEAGEVAEIMKKSIRGDGGVEHTALAKELGDVLFYVTKMASLYDMTLGQIMEANIQKLRSRRERGTQRGSGDNR